MRFRLLGLVAAVLAGCGGPATTSRDQPAARDSATSSRPNVVIILTDDMGYGDLSSYGHPLIRTPHIDRLAAEGQRWTSFYASSPLCNPSRIALMTGRMPIRIHDGGRRPDLPHTYEAMKSSTSEDFRFSLFRQKEAIETPTHQPTLTKRDTEESVNWLRRQIAADSPFFLFLGHTMPHVPIFRSPEFEGHSNAGVYGDVIEELDWSVGQVIAVLEEGGVSRDTLVIFSSDNGPWRTYYDLGGSSGPFRDGKHTAWEGGFRVPGIFWWPGGVQPGVVDGIGVQVDLMATLATLTGSTLPDLDLDSIDLSSTLLEDAPSPRTEWFYYGTPGNLWAARVGNYKLVLESWESLGKEGELSWRGFDNRQTHDPALLFNLSTDLGERLDVAGEHPEIVETIRQAIREHRERIAEGRPAVPGRL